MRTIFLSFLLLLAFCAPSNLSAQRGINKLYRKHKRSGDENFRFRVPRPVFWVVSLFPKHRDERKLVRAVKNVRLLVSEGNTKVKATEVGKMLAVAESAGYEPLLFVRDGSTRVSINAKERKGKIRGMFIVVHEPDNFVLISMRTRLKPEQVTHLINRLNEEQKVKNKSEKNEKNDKPLIPIPMVPVRAKVNTVSDEEAR